MFLFRISEFANATTYPIAVILRTPAITATTISFSWIYLFLLIKCVPLYGYTLIEKDECKMNRKLFFKFVRKVF